MNLTGILILVRQKNGSEKIYRVVNFLCESTFRCRSKRYKDSIEIGIQLDHPRKVMAAVIFGVSNMKFDNPLPSLIKEPQKTVLDIAEQYFREEGLLKSRVNDVVIFVSAVDGLYIDQTVTHCITEFPTETLNIESTLESTVLANTRNLVAQMNAAQSFGSVTITPNGQIKYTVSAHFPNGATETDIDFLYCDLMGHVLHFIQILDAAAGGNDSNDDGMSDS